MQAIIYRCPHCNRTIEVTEEMIDSNITCPNPDCHQPFELRVPEGKVVGSHDADEEQVGEFRFDRHDVHDERTLTVVHPAVFRRHPFQTLGMLLLVVGGLYLAFRWGFDADEGTAWLVGLGLAVLGAIWAGYWVLRMIYTTLTITTERSVVRRGIIARETSEVRHDDVRNLQVDQNIIERLLFVGDVAISSAGQDDMEIDVEGVPKPSKVADEIRQHQKKTA